MSGANPRKKGPCEGQPQAAHGSNSVPGNEPYYRADRERRRRQQKEELRNPGTNARDIRSVDQGRCSWN